MRYTKTPTRAALVLLAASLPLVSCSAAPADDAPDPANGDLPEVTKDDPPLLPVGPMHGAPILGASIASSAPTAGAVVTGNGIDYHGGRVMGGAHNVYLVWYGNWANDPATQILPQFINALSGSPYFNINTTYGDNTGANVPNQLAVAGQVFDTGSQGTSLSEASLQAAITTALRSGRLPTDSNGLYLVLTSADIAVVTFCSQFCGFHNHATLNGIDLKYAHIGNTNRCPAFCAVPPPHPNNNVAVDGMASVIAHEISETVTDPDITAWFDANGEENADKCSFDFGTTFTTANGARANVTLGGRNFLIQRNWLNANGGGCVISFSGAQTHNINFSGSIASQGGFSFTPNFTSASGTLTATLNVPVGTTWRYVLDSITVNRVVTERNGAGPLTITANVPAGTYNFFVQASTGSGSWTISGTHP